MLPSQLKQRTIYKHTVDLCFERFNFESLLFPEPISALYLSTSGTNSFSPKYLDTWSGKFKIILPNGSDIEVDLIIQIKDWNFLSLPEVYIKGPLHEQLQQLIGLAHFLPMPFYNPLEYQEINSYYFIKICYSTHKNISLPRHNPRVLIEWIFQQCQKLFNDSLIDTNTRDEDLKKDLSVMWEQLSSIIHFSEIDFNYTQRNEINKIKLNKEINNKDIFLLQHVRSCFLSAYEYIHNIEPHSIKHEGFIGPAEWYNTYKDTKEVITTYFLVINSQSSIFKIPSLSIFSQRILNYQENFHKDKEKLPSHNMPILRLLDLIFWLKTWQISSLNLWRKLFLSLFSHNNTIKFSEFYFCIIIDKIPLSFCISFPKKLKYFSNYRQISKELKLLRQTKDLKSLKSSILLAQISLIPTNTINTTADFIFNRNIKNMKQENLSSRSIVIIGCGAIGGYLAHNLARLGAGSEMGELILIDPENFSEDNIGRHILGKNNIGESKVEALKQQLLNDLPDINIKTFCLPIEDFIGKKVQGFNLQDADILIDATAKSGVADLLNEWRIELDYPQPCFIHLWIRDNGECVQGLLKEPSTDDVSNNYACRSCLQNAGSSFLDQYDALKGNVSLQAYAACSDFTPYSVSASMSAAALGTDIILDYVNDIISPRYRTRYSERWQGSKIESVNALKANDCPYCGSSK